MATNPEMVAQALEVKSMTKAATFTNGSIKINEYAPPPQTLSKYSVRCIKDAE